jgi:hypothetical protein
VSRRDGAGTGDRVTLPPCRGLEGLRRSVPAPVGLSADVQARRRRREGGTDFAHAREPLWN